MKLKSSAKNVIFTNCRSLGFKTGYEEKIKELSILKELGEMLRLINELDTRMFLGKSAFRPNSKIFPSKTSRCCC